MSSLRPMITDFNIWEGSFYQSPAQNFSYEYIPTSCCMKVYEYQQMILHTLITVDGLIIVDGTLVILD